ncbi:MAG: hypothetical protein M1284_01490 [Candidatus Parvarchaeota archaeon]|jgi:hypothetical protein|nr:hypothetical protein [Candidatus Parvarchaeota archaeon]MCL5420408.1 hypothetical protein [Candidatus Parvarchaeota archaeon]
MDRRIVFLLIPVFLMLLSFGSVKASSASTSFNILNNTLSMNQFLYFNVSANFPTATNFSIIINDTSVIQGNLHANFTGYKILKYNITNFPAGTYSVSVNFSTLKFPLKASNELTILSKPSFTFLNNNINTEIMNNSAALTITLLNNGNTPMRINWSLPILKGISIALNFQQSFNLPIDSKFIIPINMTLSSGYQRNLSFYFTGTYQNYSATKVYSTYLIKPVINMSFYGGNTTSVNATRELWISYIKNYNNVPVRILLQFALEVNGSTVYYTVPYELNVSATKISVYLPTSKVESVKISYESGNFSTVTESIFSAKKQPVPLTISSIVNTLGYIIFTVIAVVILSLIHIRVKKKGKKK